MNKGENVPWCKQNFIEHLLYVKALLDGDGVYRFYIALISRQQHKNAEIFYINYTSKQVISLKYSLPPLLAVDHTVPQTNVIVHAV